jgi:nucleoside-triphosphatase
MNAVKKNIFLTGAPSSGKTTVIRKVIQDLGLPANGFYTEEERVAGRRVGFLMQTLDGRKGYLAHQDIQSQFHIRRYGVSIENIETVAVPSIIPVSRNVVILDEIGKMECFSEVFRKAALHALDSPNIVVGTITFGGDDFILAIKQREDIEIREVTAGNRDLLPDLIVKKIANLLKQAGDPQ